MPDLKQALRDFVATSNSGKYKTEDELMSKFPELNGYDVQSLRDFVATSNSNKYKTEDEVFSKFPEFDTLKKKDITSVVQEQQVAKPMASPLAGGLLASQQTEDISKLGLTEPQVGPETPTPIPTEEQKKTLAAEQAAPKTKAFDVSLMTKKLEQSNKEKQQLYSEDPTLATKRAKEEQLKKDNDNILTAEESINNTFQNFATGLKQTAPKMSLVADQILEKTLGKELANSYINFMGYNPFTDEYSKTREQYRDESLNKLDELSNQMRETKAVTGAVMDLSAPDLVAVTVDAAMSVVQTAVSSLATGGVALATDMVGGAIYDYNSEKAKSLGKTTAQLFNDGQADLLAPTVIGSASFALEKLGLKGVDNLIKKKLTGSFLKKASLFGWETNKEGMTEWVQEGLNSANKVLALGGDMLEAGESAVDTMFSEKGLEVYLKGALGSATVGGVGQMVSKDNYNKALELSEKNQKLLNDLRKGNLDADTKSLVLDVLSDNKSEMNDLLNIDRDVVDKLSDEDKAKLADAYVELNNKRKYLKNGNISDVLKSKIEEDVDKLETNISGLLGTVKAVSEIDVKTNELNDSIKAAQSELDAASEELAVSVEPSDKISAQLKVDEATDKLQEANTELTDLIKESEVEAPTAEEVVVEAPKIELSDEAQKLNELLGLEIPEAPAPKAAPRKRTTKAETPKAPAVEAPKVEAPTVEEVVVAEEPVAEAPVVEAPKVEAPVTELSDKEKSDLVKSDNELRDRALEIEDKLRAQGLRTVELMKNPELMDIEKQREDIKNKLNPPAVPVVAEAPVVDEVEAEYLKEFNRITAEKKNIRESKLKPEEKDVKLKALDAELTVANNKRKGVAEKEVIAKKEPSKEKALTKEQQKTLDTIDEFQSKIKEAKGAEKKKLENELSKFIAKSDMGIKYQLKLDVNDNLSEEEAQEVEDIFNEELNNVDRESSESFDIESELDPSVETQQLEVKAEDKRPEATLMSKLRIPLNFIFGKSVGLGMSDTLTTGERTVEALNPTTGKIESKTIRDEGGIGYPFKSLNDLINGTVKAGQKIYGWAAVGKGAGSAMINAAKKATKISGKDLKQYYFDNLDLTEEQKKRISNAIPDNKEYGLVTIYKMGEDGIKSNEAYASEAFRQIETKLNEDEKKQFFELAKERIKSIKWKGKSEYGSLFKNINSFEQLNDLLHSKESKLPLGTKTDILQKVFLSTEATVSKEGVNPIGDLLKSKGISIESVAREIEEPVMKGVKVGQPMIVIAIDPTSKVIEDKNRERHKNYPFGVEGFPVGLFNETTQMHHLSPQMMDSFVKTATVIVDENAKLNGEPVRISISQTSDGKFNAEEGKGGDKKTVETANSLEALKAKLKKQGYVLSEEILSKRYTQKINGTTYNNLLQKAKSGFISIFKDPKLSAQEKLVKFLQKTFPGIAVEINTTEYENIQNDLRAKKLLNKNGETYGFVKDGRVFLNPKFLNNNTPIHEFGHVWNAFAKNFRPEIYSKGVDLIKDSKYFDSILNNSDYQKMIKAEFGNNAIIKDKQTGKFKVNEKNPNFEAINDYLNDEALAKAIGNKGELFVNEAQKRNFKNWLNDLFEAIKKVVGFESMTAEQFQNLKLNDFVNAAVKELLSGKEISKITTLELSEISETKMKFAIEDSMAKIIKVAKDNNFSDAAIKEVLKSRGYTNEQITEAFPKKLSKAIDIVKSAMAAAKENIEEGKAILNDAIEQIITKGNITLKNAELLRSRVEKLNLENEAQVAKFLASAEKMFVKTPTIEYIREAYKASKVVPEAVKKANLIKEIIAFVKSKAKISKTLSGKIRSNAGLEARGQSFFSTVNEILKAATNNDMNRMIELSNELSDTNLIDNIVVKELNGEKLTVAESNLLDKVYAFDTFGDIMNMTSAEIKTLLNGLKDVSKESSVRLKADRVERAKRNEQLQNEATEQIKKGFEVLFDKDGNVKNESKRKNDKKLLVKAFQDFKIIEGLKRFKDTLLFRKNPITDIFRKKMAHLGTFSNLLDRGGSFFTDNIYRPLNRAIEKSLAGYQKQADKLDSFVNGGIKSLTKQLNVKPVSIMINGTETIFTKRELLTLYALSKNDVQNQKLADAGFTPNKMKEIEGLLGKEAIEFADKVVDYLSNEYYESVNEVYQKANNLDLPRIENYFPTSVIKDVKTEDDIKTEASSFSKAFNAEYASALKARTDRTTEIDVNRDFFEVVNEHFKNLENYKANALVVKDINAIFKTPAVAALTDELGVTNLMNNLINLTVNPNYGAPMERTIVDKISNKYVGYALAFKPIQALKQFTAFIAALEDYQYRKGKTTTGLDLLMFMADFAVVMAKAPSEIKKAYKMSANVRDRLNSSMSGDMMGLESGTRIAETGKTADTFMSRLSKMVKVAGGAFNTLGDIGGVLGYMANYNRDIKNGMSHEDALERFNNYNSTQSTKRATEKSTIQQSKDETTKMLTMFGSATILQMNKVSQSYTNIMRDISSGKKPKVRDIRSMYLNLAVANILFTAASNIFKYAGGDDKDKEEVLEELRMAMMGMNILYQIPLIGTVVEIGVNFVKGDERKQVNEGVNAFMRISKDVIKGLKEDDYLKASRPLAELALGFKFDVFTAAGEYVMGTDDEDTMYDLIGVSKSYRPTNEGGGISFTKDDLKRYKPNIYEKMYGPNSSYYKVSEKEREINKKKSQMEREIKDRMFNR